MSSSSFPPSSTPPALAELDLSTFPVDEPARTEWLTRILGEAACHQLGIYRIPDDLVVSVVRGHRILPFDDPEAASLQLTDRLVVIHRASRPLPDGDERRGEYR